MMKVTLMACPFCGKNNLMIHGDNECSWISCKECYAETPMLDTYDETISLWNSRKDGDIANYEIDDWEDEE